MNDPAENANPLGHFHDAVHGRFSLDELPEPFQDTLKAALSSKSLSRLKKIAQLGHTSLSFLSATHTRFSHAVGSMLVMNKLFRHLLQQKNGLPSGLFQEIEPVYRRSSGKFGSVAELVHCHLLLACLYQDVGELPFHKVTCQFYHRVDSDIQRLNNELPRATPAKWSLKEIFAVRSIIADARSTDLAKDFFGYDLELLSYLITGDGAAKESPLTPTLRQLMDGVIDADRLDYVFRDASVTIGSLGSPATVIESIVSYNLDRIVVGDARNVIDFLATRMRLWTHVYMSPDVQAIPVRLHIRWSWKGRK